MHIGAIVWAILMIPTLGYAEEIEELPAQQPIGYVDSNKDGVNDRFADADGNGVNDVTKKSYPHHFQFKDEDRPWRAGGKLRPG